jgi:hypothetical protein
MQPIASFRYRLLIGDPLPTAFHHSSARREFPNNQLEKQIITPTSGCEEPEGELMEGRRIYSLHAGAWPVFLLTNLLQKAASLQLAAIVTCRLRKH